MRPGDPEAMLRRALALLQSGKTDKAITILRKLLAAFPDHPQLLLLLGSAEAQRGNTAVGLRHLERLLLLEPGHAAAHNNVGLALQALKRPDEALKSFDRAIALLPGSPEAHINRGLALREAGRFDEALASFERALRIDPTNAEQHNNRGNVLLDLGRPEESLASFDRAIAIDNGYAEARAGRGSALQLLGRTAEALADFDRAIVLNPRLAQAHNLRGDLLLQARREADARDSYERAYRLDPSLEFLLPRLLYSRLRICDWNGIPALLAGLEAKIARGGQLCIPFDALGLTGDPALQRRVAQSYAARRFPPGESGGPLPRQPRPKIRLGYFSADYRDHATTRLIAELFELHDRDRFELIGFDFGPLADDEMHRRVRSAFDRFIDVRPSSDRDVARLSRELQVDIAIDLKGYTEDARPGIFAARAAPVQVNYLGYPGTLGVETVDYIIADERLVPPASQVHYAEKIVLLPDSYQVNDRRRVLADRSFDRDELGLPTQGFVFCCFNNNYKITPPVFEVWMRLLLRLPHSVLWLIQDSPTAAANLRREAEGRGIAAQRLVFAPRMPLPEHLARHRCADLFLDTLPYNAHTTASDALWAGLPVLTCAGEAFASRVGASLLAAAGLPELITYHLDDYEALAFDLATTPGRLAEVRERLQSGRSTAPLFDTPRFARHLEAAYLQMHERSVAGLPADHIRVAPLP